MEYELHHGIIVPTGILDREHVIDMLHHAGHGYDDDESTLSLLKKLISDIGQGLIPAH